MTNRDLGVLTVKQGLTTFCGRYSFRTLPQGGANMDNCKHEAITRKDYRPDKSPGAQSYVIFRCAKCNATLSIIPKDTSAGALATILSKLTKIERALTR